MLCQRLTDAIRYILKKKGFTLFNYIDDCIGCDEPEIAARGFEELVNLMHELGLPLSVEKLYSPSTAVPVFGH